MRTHAILTLDGLTTCCHGTRARDWAGKKFSLRYSKMCQARCGRAQCLISAGLCSTVHLTFAKEPRSRRQTCRLWSVCGQARFMDSVLRFTDEQLDQLRAAARPIPWALRQAYLERIAALLSGQRFGNGEVQRAAAQAQRELIGVAITK